MAVKSRYKLPAFHAGSLSAISAHHLNSVSDKPDYLLIAMPIIMPFNRHGPKIG